jgi:branched-chain amino acid transport system substrate-binding protein
MGFVNSRYYSVKISPRLRTRAVVTLAVSALAVATLAGCGSNTKSGGAASSAAGSTAASAVACTGTTLKFTSIFSTTGPLALFGNSVTDAATAAVKAVNATCASGHPISVNVCDDQSTPNGALACGRTAASDGSIAIVGYSQGVGSSDTGVTASMLPSLFTTASTAFDTTSPLSFPLSQPAMEMLGNVEAAKALGATSFLFAAVDIPGAHIQAAVAQKAAAANGLTFDSVYFPLATTDFAPIAASIIAKKPGALTFLMPTGAQFMTSLLSEGYDLSKTPVIINAGILTDAQKSQLGSKINGLYEVGDIVPTSDTSNAGIAQMKKDYAAAGLSFTASLGTRPVQEWSAIHALGDTLTKAVADTLTPASLVTAVQAHGVYNEPAIVPFNFSALATGPAAAYGAGRVFSTYVGLFKTTDGVSSPVGGFQDLNNGFTIKQ